MLAPEPAFFRPRLVALPACACIVLTSLAPRLGAAAPAEGVAPANQDAEAIFRRGQAKYETADYYGAIELWTEAYALVDSTPENASIKTLLIYNLAQAHVKAHGLDEDPIHLKQARQLLSSFRDKLSLLYEDQAQLDEEAAKVDERIAEVDAMLAEIEAANEPEPEPEPKDEPPPPALEPAGSGESADTAGRSGTPLIAAGGVALGLGAAFGAVAILGAVMGANTNDISALDPLDYEGREQQFTRGRVGNGLLVVGAIGAGVLLPTGVALLVVGARRNKSHNKSHNKSARLDPRVGASWGGAWGQGGGLTLSGRF